MHLHVPVTLALALAAAASDAPVANGTWILQIEGDARELSVAGATHKAFAYRAPRNPKDGYRIELIGKGAKRLCTVPLDLSNFCLDPAHRGRKPHVRGDVVVKHAVSVTVKIPARGDVVELRLVKAAAGEPSSRPVLLGKISRAALDRKLAREQKKEVK